jgi:hypothetical protein
MIKEWYYDKNNGQRLLSVEEIASACCIADKEVRGWFGESVLKHTREEDEFLDSSEVILFLIRNSIPVPSSLLPPNTRKILFIVSDEYVFHDYVDTVDRICRFFAKTCNILVESESAGRLADLRVFTFSPDAVVIFLKTYDKATVNTLNLLSCFPEPKTVLLLDSILKIAVDEGFVDLSADLVVSDALPPDKLISQLRSVFPSC